MASGHHAALLNDGKFDEDGFMREPRHRNEKPADLIAEADGSGELTAEHWHSLFIYANTG
jgi:sulfur relay (sulfurtransferase) DsrC/TusE family protein